MKHNVLFLLWLFALSFLANAQGTGEISYYPVVTGDGMPMQATQSLTTKMEHILAQNGFGTCDHAERFIMLAKCNIQEKDITPTVPPRISQIVEVTFILGDIVENKTYASFTINLKGIGINEHKAWQTALNSVKPNNPKFKTMLEESVKKIEIYYADNCKKLIAEAQTLASIGDYERAIASLMSVPDVCVCCHEQALEAATRLYKQKIDTDGVLLLSKANRTWTTKQDVKSAEEALMYIDLIPVDSSSFADADALVMQIAKKLSSDKEREWQQRLKEYNDKKDYRLKEQANAHARSIATIAACRSIAGRWADNQPQTKIYLNW